jgi:raffinose/stachyose/melibiose transport system permease protein
MEAGGVVNGKVLGRGARAVLVWALLLALVVVVLYPLLWMLSNAFRTNSDIFNHPFGIPTSFHFDAFVTAWKQGVGDFVVVSVGLTVIATILTEAISAWAAYGLTRINIPLGRAATLMVMAGLMLVPTAAVIPLVKMFQSWHLYDTFPGLLILYTVFQLPFTIFLMRAYMMQLPREVDEAAIIDGAGRAARFWRIILPMSTPIIMTTTVLNVLANWNEYLFAMLFTSGSGIQTLPVGLANLLSKNGTQYPVVFAGMAIAALPMVILFFLCQRYFIRGLAGGVGK